MKKLIFSMALAATVAFGGFSASAQNNNNANQKNCTESACAKDKKCDKDSKCGKDEKGCKQKCGRKDGKGKKGDRRDNKKFYQSRAFNGIELTDAQKTKLDNFEASLRKDAQAAKEKAHEGKDKAKNFTQEELKKLKEERMAKKAEMKQKYLDGVKSILTTEQYQKYLENSAKTPKFDKGMKHGKGHGKMAKANNGKKGRKGNGVKGQRNAASQTNQVNA